MGKGPRWVLTDEYLLLVAFEDLRMTDGRNCLGSPLTSTRGDGESLTRMVGIMLIISYSQLPKLHKSVKEEALLLRKESLRFRLPLRIDPGFRYGPTVH